MADPKISDEEQLKDNVAQLEHLLSELNSNVFSVEHQLEEAESELARWFELYG